MKKSSRETYEYKTSPGASSLSHQLAAVELNVQNLTYTGEDLLTQIRSVLGHGTHGEVVINDEKGGREKRNITESLLRLRKNMAREQKFWKEMRYYWAERRNTVYEGDNNHGSCRFKQ